MSIYCRRLLESGLAARPTDCRKKKPGSLEARRSHLQSMQTAHILDSRAYVRRAANAPPSAAMATARVASLEAAVGTCLHSFASEGCLELCETCHSCHFQRLRASHFAVDALQGMSVVPQCESCASDYVVPRLDEQPAPLLHLSAAVLAALQCLWLDIGYWRPHAQGLQRHAKVSQLQWPTQTVKARVAASGSAVERARATAALSFLRHHCHAYSRWYGQCRRLLKLHAIKGLPAEEKSSWASFLCLAMSGVLGSESLHMTIIHRA